MGRKAKRLRLLARIAAKEKAKHQATLKNENSVKIEELKAATPEPIIEETVKLEEPEIIEEPKVTEEPIAEIKKAPAKKATVKKAAPKKNTRAKTTSRKPKAKKK
jgi:hypothetical protein